MSTLSLFHHRIKAGEKRKFQAPVAELPDGTPVQVPVVVVRGAKEGPTLCLSGVVHGDEYNGLVTITRLYRELDPQDLAGTVIGIPLMNPFAYFAEARLNKFDYELQNLNRIFPGDPEGDLGQRMAHTLYAGFFARADYIIDYHEGGRDFMAKYMIAQGPTEQLRNRVQQMARWFGHGVPVLAGDLCRPSHSGTLTGVAAASGIPALGVELGGSGRVWDEFVALGVAGTRNIMIGLGMLGGELVETEHEQFFCATNKWPRPTHAGLLVPVPETDRLGAIVDEGQLLALIYNPFGEVVEEIRAPFRAVILDTRHSAVVYPGDWTYSCAKLA